MIEIAAIGALFILSVIISVAIAYFVFIGLVKV